MSQGYDINSETSIVEVVKLVDEISSTEYYLGFSRNGGNESGEFWQIKRIHKIGSTWKFQYPNGNQNFIFKWDERLSYDYSA